MRFHFNHSLFYCQDLMKQPHDMAMLVSIKGISDLTAALFIAEVKDLSKKNNQKTAFLAIRLMKL